MRDADFLIEQVEKELKKCRAEKENLYERGECDLCGTECRIVEGLCVQCRDRYKLWEPK